MKAPRSGRVLNSTDASLVKAMLGRGDRQQDIASTFGVNGGRIGDINTGKTFFNISKATSGIPPCAPFVVIDANNLRLLESIFDDILASNLKSGSKADLQQILLAMQTSSQLRDGV